MITIFTGTIRKDYQSFGGEIDGSWITEYGIGNLDPGSSKNLPSSVLLFLKKDKTWEGKITWFPSKRKDLVGRPMRYAILGKGKIGDDDSRLFLSLINYVIESTENNESEAKQQEFGNKLDECFTENKLKTYLIEDSSGCEEELRKIINENLMASESKKEDAYPFINNKKESILYINNIDKLHEGYNLLVSDVDITFDTLVVYNSRSFSEFEKLVEKKAAGAIYIESNNIYENGQLKKDLQEVYNFDSLIDTSNNTSAVGIEQRSGKKNKSLMFVLAIFIILFSIFGIIQCNNKKSSNKTNAKEIEDKNNISLQIKEATEKVEFCLKIEKVII